MTRMAFETLETIENLQLQIIMMNDQIRELREMLKTQQEEINRLRAE
jgi:predicted  nucleic acid-binding Zn-ribbon protein